MTDWLIDWLWACVNWNFSKNIFPLGINLNFRVNKSLVTRRIQWFVCNDSRDALPKSIQIPIYICYVILQDYLYLLMLMCWCALDTFEIDFLLMLKLLLRTCIWGCLASLPEDFNSIWLCFPHGSKLVKLKFTTNNVKCSLVWFFYSLFRFYVPFFSPTASPFASI